MKILSIILILFCTLKGLYYAKYEFFNNHNNFGSIFIILLSLSGFIFNFYLIFYK